MRRLVLALVVVLTMALMRALTIPAVTTLPPTVTLTGSVEQTIDDAHIFSRSHEDNVRIPAGSTIAIELTQPLVL